MLSSPRGGPVWKGSAPKGCLCLLEAQGLFRTRWSSIFLLIFWAPRSLARCWFRGFSPPLVPLPWVDTEMADEIVHPFPDQSAKSHVNPELVQLCGEVLLQYQCNPKQNVMYFHSYAPSTHIAITCSWQNPVLCLHECKHRRPWVSSGSVKLLALASTAHPLPSRWSGGLHNMPTASAPAVQVSLWPPLPTRAASKERLQDPPAPRASNSRGWGQKQWNSDLGFDSECSQVGTCLDLGLWTSLF